MSTITATYQLLLRSVICKWSEHSYLNTRTRKKVFRDQFVPSTKYFSLKTMSLSNENLIPLKFSTLISVFAFISSNSIILQQQMNGVSAVPAIDDTYATAYSSRFGYVELQAEEMKTNLPTPRETLSKAVKEFQEFNNLKVTENLDIETLNLMHQPKCGVPDKFTEHSRRKRYTYNGNKWNQGEITYVVKKAPTDPQHRDKIPLFVVQYEIDRALKIWQQFVPFKLTLLKDPHSDADVMVSFEMDGFNGPGGYSAYASQNNINFDNGENWNIEAESGFGKYSLGNVPNLFSTALHEIGHTLGLGHSKDPTSIMYYSYVDASSLSFKLRSDDIDAIQSLYPKKNKKPSTSSSIPHFESSSSKTTEDLNVKILNLMHRPRYDIPNKFPKHSRSKRYAFNGNKRDKKEITYLVDKFPKNPRYRSNIDYSIVEDEIDRALKVWQQYIPLKLTLLRKWDPDSEADVKISFDKESSARKRSPRWLASATLNTITFSNEVSWNTHTEDGRDFFSVALHEIGHTLGLNHSEDTDAVMYRAYTDVSSSHSKLRSDDIKGIQSLYPEKNKPQTRMLFPYSKSNPNSRSTKGFQSLNTKKNQMSSTPANTPRFESNSNNTRSVKIPQSSASNGRKFSSSNMVLVLFLSLLRLNIFFK